MERDEAASGEFSVRAADNQVLRYRFDAKTSVESENRMIEVRRLHPGDQVEVLSDGLPDTFLRYARMIHVIEPTPPARSQTRGRYRSPKPGEDRLLTPPRGDMTLSGVISHLNGGTIVLHTREGSEQTILLRQDTKYLENGELAAVADLKTNMRVFIRAGKDLYGRVEAYQVAWGAIMEPK